MATEILESNNSTPSAFSFSLGDLEPALTNTATEYTNLYYLEGGDYYQPPVSQRGLAQLLRANAHHGAIAYFMHNMAVRWFNETDVIDTDHLGNIAMDYKVFGNAYFQIVKNQFGQPWFLKHLPAVYMRRKKQSNRYCWLKSFNETIDFEEGEVVHIKRYDPLQSVYGVPEYLGGINSVQLNESSTLFRRKYYVNGAHMGYILYSSDANLKADDEKELKDAIKNSKGPGNFKSMFLNIPNGKEKSVQIIPIGDFSTKDEFEKIKNITRGDIIAMWRISPALAGVLPENAGGFGDLDKITRMNYENEIVPIQRVLLKINQHMPKQRQIVFATPEFMAA